MNPTTPLFILCLGDSLTEGFGVSREHSYPALLQRRLIEFEFPHRVINAGISGDTTQGVLRRLDPLLRTPIAMAIVTIGLNDAFMGVSMEVIHDTMERIIQKLQPRLIPVVLGGLELPSDFPRKKRQEFAAIVPALAERHPIHRIPFFLEGIFENPRFNQWDNIHPNEAGYRRVLDHAWTIIHPLLHPQTISPAPPAPGPDAPMATLAQTT
ncbi:MAG: arylesterase [Magnetococcales bacterium]|nr:arylesterase [Magnetococcales bacterium]